MEVDFLEKNVLQAIALSSAFTIREIKLIFEECRSFDQTIRVLKYCAERGVSVNKAIENIKSI